MKCKGFLRPVHTKSEMCAQDACILSKGGIVQIFLHFCLYYDRTDQNWKWEREMGAGS